MTNVLINSMLPASAPLPPANNIKWTPGHYVGSVTRPSTPAAFSAGSATMDDMSAAKSSYGRFMGYQGEYTWYYLESAAGGTYYYNIIDDDLAYLATKSAADGVDYKLIIYLENMESFQYSVVTTPQPVVDFTHGTGSSTKSVCPDYIISGGGVYYGYGGVVMGVKIWEQAWMDRLIALCQALGTRYDNNPHVEMIIPFSETGVNVFIDSSNDLPPTYSASALATQWGRFFTQVSPYWTHTNKMFFANWQWTGSTVASYGAVCAAAVAAGWGLGGPDILYNSGGWPTQGDQYIRGVLSGSGSTTDLRSKIPICFEDQANWATWPSQTSVGTESYEYGTEQASHVVWTDNGTLQDNGATGSKWSDTVAALDAVNFRIAGSAYPSNY